MWIDYTLCVGNLARLAKGVSLDKPKHPYVIDPGHAGALARPMQQDQLLTRGMGGLFPAVMHRYECSTGIKEERNYGN
ncbi:hypothetical protein [Thermogemmatispora sp.]|uniref:hypothetical protein n=1 Tax=Thermogemmatispora sp. TaxID=1968838 RepID=UPI0035E452E9